ncbi:hypothetical protein [Eggerthella timonensis]|uniref:hypothetical protein n=1 Tax=Eggerthella timonensis TaxID=1871008 RepID=UPI000C778784|nr:hypothetical protein [Eggerthella timonensis]
MTIIEENVAIPFLNAIRYAIIFMPTIAAILLYVAYNMSGWRSFTHPCKTAARGTVSTLPLTFGLTIVFDLV